MITKPPSCDLVDPVDVYKKGPMPDKATLRRHRKRLIDILDWLQENWPLKYPVQLLHKKLSHPLESGECDFNKRKFIITIDPRTQWCTDKSTVLIHEYTHALIWHGYETSHHGDEFFIMYGRLFRGWHEE